MKKLIVGLSIAALVISFVSLFLQIKTAQKEGIFDKEAEKSTENIEATKVTE